MKFILKIILGLIIWLILIEIQWTFFESHTIENLIFIAFGICLLLLIFSGFYYLIKKKQILKFAVFWNVLFFLFFIINDYSKCYL